jgi:hypothetical protein
VEAQHVSLPHVVLAVVSIALMLGLFGMQIWLDQQQLAQLKAEVARQKTEGEQRLAKQKADFELWQARMKAQPGNLGIPLPLPTPLPPPMVWQPPLNPLFPIFFPALLAPLFFVTIAEQQRLAKLQQAEEEERTPYSEEDLMQDWEFKIVRCTRNLFDKPDFLQSSLQEEACAGWRLVEKFDGTRVRLKRLTSERGRADLPPNYDPYRTVVGPKVTFHPLLFVCWTGFSTCAVLIPILTFVQSKDPILPEAFRMVLWGLSAGAILFGALAIGLTARGKRAQKRRSVQHR